MYTLRRQNRPALALAVTTITETTRTNQVAVTVAVAVAAVAVAVRSEWMVTVTERARMSPTQRDDTEGVEPSTSRTQAARKYGQSSGDGTAASWRSADCGPHFVKVCAQRAGLRRRFLQHLLVGLFSHSEGLSLLVVVLPHCQYNKQSTPCTEHIVYLQNLPHCTSDGRGARQCNVQTNRRQ